MPERVDARKGVRAAKRPPASDAAHFVTASVHLRQVPAEYEAATAAAVRKAIEPFSSSVKMRPGRKILELLPRVRWDKGKAARRILQTTRNSSATLPVCIGDDVTDEDLFREFPEGITIRVGGVGKTAAKYVLADIDEVLRLLEQLACAWSFSRS